ncbi:heme ABC exporter ATP-binding protein CcmA [Paludibaculum fermentans]|uniref:Heme ABC exporter ATP-binding protein CcmA n=1 Tax=Paludibaculum fermentans TaxID=1473598 RepID=A0A7S7NWQ9_PALFE|nr:heme ABC exporter ATP-binding protein CcmA [Paludibaculum fermentans]QOY91218.1 heme ABC exporter ATP-binding protein CcmA [Paludibaculum fermentans]
MKALAVEGVWKFYGDYAALREVSFDIEPGQCVALLGRNGAGKTTLIRILAGLSRPSRGVVKVFDTDFQNRTTRNRIGILGHGIAIYDELSAYENLRLFASLYGLEKPDAAANHWLERTGLDRVKDSLVREFSRGMRQRLAVARAFLHDPQMLLLDEPFTALDDRAIALLQNLLRDALKEGRTVLMSTHQLREALELATHVVLINRGKLAHRGLRTQEMLDDPGYLYRTYGEA